MHAVYQGPVPKQTVKDFSHDGAIRIGDLRHLEHCHEANSQTWMDRGVWTPIKPRDWDMRQIDDSPHEFGYDPGNHRYYTVWHESFFDNRPHYDNPFNAETVGDFHEAALAFARRVRQDRWDTIRTLGFGFTLSHIIEAAEIIEEIIIAHWHFNDAYGGAARRILYPPNAPGAARAQNTAPPTPPPDEPTHRRGRSVADDPHSTDRSRSPLQHGANTAANTQAPATAKPPLPVRSLAPPPQESHPPSTTAKSPPPVLTNDSPTQQPAPHPQPATSGTSPPPRPATKQPTISTMDAAWLQHLAQGWNLDIDTTKYTQCTKYNSPKPSSKRTKLTSMEISASLTRPTNRSHRPLTFSR
jgi:hypothetical protein